MLKLSNPRDEAKVEDWPSGGQRVTADFKVERNAKGVRCSRTTTTSYGKVSKPKACTYHFNGVIVDGDDGRVYFLGYTDHDQIVLWPGTLKHPVYYYDDDAEFQEYLALFGDEFKEMRNRAASR